MQFADPRDVSTAYLILRHLYDGDVIDWPIPEDHPQRHVFAGLEQQGYIARWDRIWPLHDRYRLTENGIATIEAVYKPEGAEALYDELRARNLSAQERRYYLASRGYDQRLWPLLHDPSTHWDTWGTYGSPYYSYFWEDEMPYRPTRYTTPTSMTTDMMRGAKKIHDATSSSTDDDYDDDRRYDDDDRPYNVDLDHEAQAQGTQPSGPDVDVS